ncbi:hypothetical protein GWI33_013690 [Rhynchophorus ferrugineus]|uniref:Uncharacterized protein n=1 Tax=Rhynchophorus ferrugineus TaxID=354439 RepID=A0A834IGH9_RHYFE|nr:hypothetical protein GWI33_013690 [Rhynchophorus ferrugineus]
MFTDLVCCAPQRVRENKINLVYFVRDSLGALDPPSLGDGSIDLHFSFSGDNVGLGGHSLKIFAQDVGREVSTFRVRSVCLQFQ